MHSCTRTLCLVALVALFPGTAQGQLFLSGGAALANGPVTSTGTSPFLSSQLGAGAVFGFMRLEGRLYHRQLLEPCRTDCRRDAWSASLGLDYLPTQESPVYVGGGVLFDDPLGGIFWLGWRVRETDRSMLHLRGFTGRHTGLALLFDLAT